MFFIGALRPCLFAYYIMFVYFICFYLSISLSPFESQNGLLVCYGGATDTDKFSDVSSSLYCLWLDVPSLVDLALLNYIRLIYNSYESAADISSDFFADIKAGRKRLFDLGLPKNLVDRFYDR